MSDIVTEGSPERVVACRALVELIAASSPRATDLVRAEQDGTTDRELAARWGVSEVTVRRERSHLRRRFATEYAEVRSL